MIELLTAEARNIIAEIKKDFITHDVSATGATAESFKERVTRNSLQILADDSLEQVLSGSPPGTKVQVSRLDNWRKARGIQMSSTSIAIRIEKLGTRLFRGQDPRYPGKKDRRFVVEDNTTMDKAREIADKWSSEKRIEIVKELLSGLT